MDALNAGLRRKILRATLGGTGAATQQEVAGGGLRRLGALAEKVRAVPMIAPYVAGNLAYHAGQALNDQANFPVSAIQNRGGFAASTAKDLIGRTDLIPNAVGGVAAGLGAGTAAAVTGTYPSGAPAVGLHRLGAAADAFGNAYTQTTAQEANLPVQASGPTLVPGAAPAPVPGAVPSAPVPADVQALTGLRQVPGISGVRPVSPPALGQMPFFQNEAAQNKALLGVAQEKAAGTYRINAEQLSQQLHIPFNEAAQMLAQSYQTRALARAKQVQKGLTPVQAANMKIKLANLGLTADQVKQYIGLRRDANIRANLGAVQAAQTLSGKNVSTVAAQQTAIDPGFNAGNFRAAAAALKGPHNPQELQNLASNMSASDSFVRNAYSGNTSIRLPFTCDSPAPIPPGKNLMQYYVGRSATPITGSNNLVFEVPNSNGKLQRFQMDWQTLSPFMKAYVQSSLAKENKAHPNKFKSPNWADYKRVSMN